MRLFFLNLAVCSAQMYITWMLLAAFRSKRVGAFGATPKKAKLALYSMSIVSFLEFATTLYDIDGPGKHFPLEIRVPVLLVQSIIMLLAL
jgi:hypothetical protein